MEGVPVCTTYNPDAINMNCTFESEKNTNIFTMTSFFTDQSESLHSLPYSFSISPPNVEPPPDSPPNVPPKAIITTSSSVGEAPLSVSFDGSGSSDPDGTIASYDWHFGDGATASGVVAHHTYTTAATYTVSLTITDNRNESASISTPVITSEATPINEPPIANLSASSLSGSIPLGIIFSGAESIDPENESMSYTWNFGDGTTAKGKTVRHIFTAEDRYNVTLTVTDPKGARSSKVTTISAQTAIAEFHIELDEIKIDNTWARVDFEEPFLNPVIIAGPPSFSNSNPVVIRIRNVTSSGFEIRLQRWRYLADTHPIETVSYIAIEKGAHTLSDGTVIEAGLINAGSNKATTFNYMTPFSSKPVIMTSISTSNTSIPATSRLTSVTKTKATVIIDKEENASSDILREQISYLACEPTNSIIGGMKVIAAHTGKIVKHKWYGIHFREQLYDTPLFLAAISPQTGGDPAVVRYSNKSTDSVQVKIEEEQSLDKEVIHAREDLSYVLISPSKP